MTVTPYQLRSDTDGMACRRDYRSQLQPVPGRELLHWIRSGGTNRLHCALTSVVHVSEYDESCMHVDCCHACISDASGRQSLGLTEAFGPAGATTYLNCSLCQAGSYSTGSGQEAQIGCIVL